MNPKVSICIPTYNQVNFLKRSLDSIIIQDYMDYEVIVTDDSIDDAVKDLIANYYAFFGDRLKYFKNDYRLGTPENWNESIRRSSGEFVKILHHDDSFSNSSSLQKLVFILESNPFVDFAFSATFINSVGYVHKITVLDTISLKKNPLILFTNNLIGAPSTTIFRRNANLHFDSNLKWLVDIEFYIRAFSRDNFSFIYSSEVLITTSSGQTHQVTNECVNNKMVEVYEYVYLFDKIQALASNYSSAAIKKCLLHVIRILNRYSIKNVKDIRNCGYRGNIHYKLKAFLGINALSPFCGRLYLKFIRISV